MFANSGKCKGVIKKLLCTCLAVSLTVCLCPASQASGATSTAENAAENISAQNLNNTENADESVANDAGSLAAKVDDTSTTDNVVSEEDESNSLDPEPTAEFEEKKDQVSNEGEYISSASPAAVAKSNLQIEEVASTSKSRAAVASTDSIITIKVPYRPQESFGQYGSVTTVDCSFEVLDEEARTCAVVRTGNGASGKAVSSSLNGWVEIPEKAVLNGTTYTVTQVGEAAFGDSDEDSACAKLSAITLPSTITAIKDYAFSYCTALKNVHRPEIGGMTAPGGTGMSDVHVEDHYTTATAAMPASLETVGKYAFFYCEAISYLTIGESIKSLDSYSYCQANGLRTVEFEGDAPTVEKYSFTGQTYITAVIYGGKQLTSTTNIFNSDIAPAPITYFAVKFYESKEGAESNTGLLGITILDDSSTYKILYKGAPEDKYKCVRGEIPAFPEGTNIWRFSTKESRNNKIAGAQKAWPEWTDAYDLNSAKVPGKITAKNMSYTGEEYLLCATDPEIKNGDTYETTQATVLEVDLDYDLIFQRKNFFGVWEDTDDTTSTGDLLVKAVGKGLYTGVLTTEIKITLDSTSKFIFDIPTWDESSSVPCAFAVSEYNATTHTGKVQVVKKTANKTEDPGKMGAVPMDYEGQVNIPETIQVEGSLFTVTAIAGGAFQLTGMDENKQYYYEHFTELIIPKTITLIGNAAFARCSKFKICTIYCDLDNMGLTSAQFGGCALSTVVLYGRAPSTKIYSLKQILPAGTIYYTIKFLDNVSEFEKYENSNYRFADIPAISQVTVKETTVLADVPDLTPTSSQVLDDGGYVPDYPDSAYGDWLINLQKPTWKYPEFPGGQELAMRSCIHDSTLAYASGDNDSIYLAHGFVLGIEKGKQYDYTGMNVINLSEVKVYPACGGLLKEGVDYNSRLMYKSQYDDEYAEVKNAIEPGDYIFVAEGLGEWTNNDKSVLSIEFSIFANEPVAGTKVTSLVTLEQPDGKNLQTYATFQVSKVGAGRALSLYGDSKNSCVYNASLGKLIIPERITYGGFVYSVEGVGDYAFNSCKNLTSIDLPCTINNYGNYAFKDCESLSTIKIAGIESEEGTAVIPSEQTSISSYTFSGCSSLSEIALNPRVTDIGDGAFAGCAISNIELPETLQSIGQSAFSGAVNLKTVTLPASLSTYPKAFAGSSIEEVTIEEGATTIPVQGFYQATNLNAVSMPSSMREICSEAFSQTALKAFTVSESLRSIGANAFSRTLTLDTIIFEGDANALSQTDALKLSTIKNVVYRERSLVDSTAIFIGSPQFYMTIKYYDSNAAYSMGEESGYASIKYGTELSLLTTSNVTSSLIYDGGAPALPANSAAWSFPEAYTLGDVLEDSTYAIAHDADLNINDLSNASVVTERGYQFTGTSVMPIENGRAKVVLANGKVLTRTTDYSWEYQRQTNGVWAKSSDVSSTGSIRIKVTPAAGSPYTGEAYGYFTIVTSLIGNTFKVNDVNGNAITYKITKYPDGSTPGEVQVGTGAAPASINTFKGEVVIPEIVTSPSDGHSYVPTSIGAKAFYRQVQVTSVIIPSTMKTFYQNAFAYEEVRGDTKSSNLTKIVFNNDLTKARFGYSIFLGCDIVNTIIYGSQKGKLEEVQPFALRPGITLTRYFTVRYHEDLAADPIATVIVKEGCFVDSLSNSDYYDWENEDIQRAPKLYPDPVTNTYYEWLFDTAGLNDEDKLIDSITAQKVPVQDDAITVMIDNITGTQTTSIPCIFTPTKQPDGEEPGEVVVGRSVDGMPAISCLTAGKIRIPDQIKVSNTVDDGSVQTDIYNVVSVGAFAFGASFEEEGCMLLTEVELPSTIKSIEQGAFYNCQNLSNVSGIEETPLQSIGAGAFMACGKLASVVIPDSVTKIDASAFCESGLVWVVLPSSLSSLGKRAFQSCANLEEVVFGGAYTLDLPAVSSATASAASKDSIERDACTSSLLILEDYLFAQCSKLARVVFELNAGALVSTTTTFEGTENIKQVFYGGKAAIIANEEVASANIYYTVNYYSTLDVAGTADRAAYVCMLKGAILGKGTLVSGSYPSLPLYHEWIYDFDSSAGLADSGVAYMRPIPYKLDSSEVDSSFSPSFIVNGMLASTAIYGDKVTVVIGSGTSVKATGFSVVDANGKTLLSTNSLDGEFSMPGSTVKLIVKYDKKLTLEAYTPTGTLQKTASLNIAQMEEAASKHQAEAAYSGWGQNSSATVLTTNSYLTLAELFNMVNMRFDAGATVIFEDSSIGYSSTVTYSELFSVERYSHPNIKDSVTDGRYVVEPALCITSSTDGKPSFDGAFKLAFGQTDQEFTQLRNTVSRWMTDIDRVTLIMSPENISGCRITNVLDRYNYTGGAIAPAPMIVDQSGRTLIPGTDYTVAYSSNINPGRASISIVGMRDYTGNVSLGFNIVRAQPISSAAAAAYSYLNALEAYPSGSKGAIVVSSSSYTETLSASALSQAMSFPILYTAKSTLSSYCKKAIQELKARSNTTKFRIVVIGSTSAIKKTVYTKLQSLAYSKSYISRIAGNDRYLTANSVCNYGTTSKYWGDTAIVVSGKNYYDALSIAAYSAWKKAPILLCKGTSILSTTKTALKKGKFKKIIVVGNTKRVSASVLKALKKIAPTTRLSGATRYSTNLAVNKWCITQGMAYNGTVIASGTKPALGFCASILAAKTGSIMCLTSASNRSNLAMLANGKSSIYLIRFAGTTAAVSTTVRNDAISRLGWDTGAIR